MHRISVLYDGDSPVTNAQLNQQLESVTDKLKDTCEDDDHSSIITQINVLTTQLKLYRWRCTSAGKNHS